MFDLPAFETSHGRWIVSPATNLNVSDLVTNIGSCFAKFCVAAEPINKNPKRNRENDKWVYFRIEWQRIE